MKSESGTVPTTGEFCQIPGLQTEAEGCTDTVWKGSVYKVTRLSGRRKQIQPHLRKGSNCLWEARLMPLQYLHCLLMQKPWDSPTRSGSPWKQGYGREVNPERRKNKYNKKKNPTPQLLTDSKLKAHEESGH